MLVSIIVAASENDAIGKNNDLPWHLPDDFRYFKRRTTGHHIIMGRKTYESMKMPLRNRVNVVVTTNKSYKAEGCIIKHSLQEALAFAREHDEKEAFVIGGATLIKQILPEADRFYLTRVKTRLEGDVFLPEINWDNWREIIRCPHPEDERHKYPFEFIEFQKK